MTTRIKRFIRASIHSYIHKFFQIYKIELAIFGLLKDNVSYDITQSGAERTDRRTSSTVANPTGYKKKRERNYRYTSSEIFFIV